MTVEETLWMKIIPIEIDFKKYQQIDIERSKPKSLKNIFRNYTAPY